MPVPHEDLARRLRGAYTEGAVSPLRDGLDPTDADGAYAVQEINTAFWLNSGRKIVGRKIGLTAKSVQRQLGVDQPDFGVLFDDMALPDGAVLSPSLCLQPKVEAEIAFVLGRDIQSTEAGIQDVIDVTEFAIAALEIVDSRIDDWKITFADTVADNGSSAFFVLGSAKQPLAGLDLYSCGMVLEINNEVVSLGAGAACLGHPLNSVSWLVNTLGARGVGLKAGDVIMTGALGPMVSLKPGDAVVARIGGVGECSMRFTETEQ